MPDATAPGPTLPTARPAAASGVPGRPGSQALSSAAPTTLATGAIPAEPPDARRMPGRPAGQALSSAASTTLASSIALVIGPTPPGIGAR